MKHSNISVFIPHMGCPNKCSFCDQNTISGMMEKRSLEQITTEISCALQSFRGDKKSAQIAFFGGSFTALDKEYMLALLKIGKKFCDEYALDGIRISTRPDAIDNEILAMLKEYSVKAIELGAQSLCDDVLSKNFRGHSAIDVLNASELIKLWGFDLGLQMMVGLYAQSEKSVLNTAEQIIKIKPDTVRIYPTVILKNTYLAELYESGEYIVFPLEKAIKICARLILMFEKENIKIIKLGLHSSTDVIKSMVGGIYHPAFRELCESAIYKEIIINEIEKLGFNKVNIYVANRDLSKALGQKKSNIEEFLKLGYDVKIIPDDSLTLRQIKCERRS